MSMAQELITALGYSDSPHYKTNVRMFEPETAHVFRAVADLGVKGIYVFQASPAEERKTLSDNLLVYLAEAQDVTQARAIHRSVWNLGKAPFLIIVLPDEVRVYTGFDYAPEALPERGLLTTVALNGTLRLVRDALEAFTAHSIDSGRIWSYANYQNGLDLRQKVDVRLLKNLQELDQALIESGDLSPDVIHALIGKYVYIRYLWDRGILTEEWLAHQGIRPEYILGRNATVAELATLSSALELRFNGRVFPIEFGTDTAPTDRHVALTASIFMGDTVTSSVSAIVQQLHLDFQAYDFKYIPIETLSAVYEQFIDDRKRKGAVYTPEILADYLLSEVHSINDLTPATRVLDPACGSGIFLVLTYRRLIEQEWLRSEGKPPDPERLKTLLENIHGVERELDACYVAEFSLILTLLHYIEPRQLHLNTDFRFPDLHNQQIFHGDFFDPLLPIWHQTESFDWIIGNPPWVKASSDQVHVREWLAQHNKPQPVGNLCVAEAFSWRVVDLLAKRGLVGLVMPATSFVNLNSAEYRKHFFQAFHVLRITNFAHLREVLFGKRSALPAATVVYRPGENEVESYDIVHVAPRLINQVPGTSQKLWALTVYEDEIQYVSSIAAQTGDTATWKLALWGTFLDRRILESIQRLFPKTLEECCMDWGWGARYPQQGAEFRAELKNEKVEYRPELAELMVFQTDLFNQQPRHRFSLLARALGRNDKPYLRKRGGTAGLRINYAPHIILSKGWDFIIYSDQDFIIPPQQMGIAAPVEDILKLKALAAYLASSLVRYYLFFQVPEWGVFRQRDSVVVSEVRKIPTPQFTSSQIQALAALQESIASQEMVRVTAQPYHAHSIQHELQAWLDAEVYRILDIPVLIQVVVDDFVQVRLPLDNQRQSRRVIGRRPTTEELIQYARDLRDELNSYALGMASHTVDIVVHDDFIECIIDVVKDGELYPISQKNITQSAIPSSQLYQELWAAAGYQFSQWAYVQRGLRLFEDTRIYLYKPARFMNWTRTQAICDANSMIGQALATELEYQ